jgi:large subunit ribosomal protein L22
MAPYKYSVEDTENTAKAAGLSLSISMKDSVEICNFIRGKNLKKSVETLKQIAEKKRALPLRRFNQNRGHKPGIGPGAYPVNTCNEIIKILENAEANAQFKGLNTTHLIINHIRAHKAATPYHAGRQRRRKMKRTNVEVVVSEGAGHEKTKESPKGKEHAKEHKPEHEAKHEHPAEHTSAEKHAVHADHTHEHEAAKHEPTKKAAEPKHKAPAKEKKTAPKEGA